MEPRHAHLRNEQRRPRHVPRGSERRGASERFFGPENVRRGCRQPGYLVRCTGGARHGHFVARANGEVACKPRAVRSQRAEPGLPKIVARKAREKLPMPSLHVTLSADNEHAVITGSNEATQLLLRRPLRDVPSRKMSKRRHSLETETRITFRANRVGEL